MTPSIFATEWAPRNLQSDKYRLSLKGIFQKVRKLGAPYVHLVYHWNFERNDISRIRDLIDTYGIGVSCVHSLTLLNRPNGGTELVTERTQLMDSIRFARAFDCAFVACNFGVNTSRDEATAIRECRTHYADCFTMAADQGVTILVENTCTLDLDEITATTDGIRNLIEGVDSPSFKLQFDPGNMHSANEEAYPYGYEHLKEHIRFLHVKDMATFDPKLDLHRRAKQANKHIETHTHVSISVPLGQGDLNWHGLFASLIRDEFDGFFDIEPHTVEDKLDEFYRCALSFYTEHTKT